MTAQHLDEPRPVGTRTTDETASLVGGAVAGLALTWLLYVPLLGWSGKLGFVFLWYAVFLLLYAVLTASSNPLAVVKDRIAGAVVQGAAVVVGLALASTVWFILEHAWPALHHLSFYSQDMAGVRPTAPLTQGGVKHALVGTAIEVGLALVMSLPLGIGTAVYLTEARGRVVGRVRTVIEAMTALPDILAGLFVYAVLIIGLHWERTGFTAALALSVTMIPIVARSSEVVLRLVPGGLREASLALGASRWQTVRRVVLPTARSGLATALILGVARVAGETAPLLIVSGASTFTNGDPFHEPMNSLPLFIFTAIRSGQSAYIARGYGAAALLLAFVLVLFMTARYLARDRVRAR
jgi:phosphate transport system permease protein